MKPGQYDDINEIKDKEFESLKQMYITKKGLSSPSLKKGSKQIVDKKDSYEDQRQIKESSSFDHPKG